MSPDTEIILRYEVPPHQSRNDPDLWIRTAEAQAANEAHVRAMCAETASKHKQSRSHFWAEVCLYIIGAGVAAAFIKGWI